MTNNDIFAKVSNYHNKNQQFSVRISMGLLRRYRFSQWHYENVCVIASEAKQSQEIANSPRITGPELSQQEIVSDQEVKKIGITRSSILDNQRDCLFLQFVVIIISACPNPDSGRVKKVGGIAGRRTGASAPEQLSSLTPIHGIASLSSITTFLWLLDWGFPTETLHFHTVWGLSWLLIIPSALFNHAFQQPEQPGIILLTLVLLIM